MFMLTWSKGCFNFKPESKSWIWIRAEQNPHFVFMVLIRTENMKCLNCFMDFCEQICNEHNHQFNPLFCEVKRTWRECEVIVAGEQCREDGWGEERRQTCEWAANPCKPPSISPVSLPLWKIVHHCSLAKRNQNTKGFGIGPLWVWKVTSLNLTIFHLSFLSSEVWDKQISSHHQKASQFISVFV